MNINLTVEDVSVDADGRVCISNPDLAAAVSRLKESDGLESNSEALGVYFNCRF